MKPPNRKQRVGRGFNGVDKTTGYAVRFEQTRSGTWCAVTKSFTSICVARRLGSVRRLINEAIGLQVDACREYGWPIPEPEGKPTQLDYD